MDNNQHQSLLEAFNETAYPLGGHGRRDIGVLLEAFEEADERQESDIYGTGSLIEDFQEEMAEVLGKPAAVFFPSGTMAQQIALRIHCDRKGLNRVGYHPLCHLEIHEQDGLKRLHHIEPVLLGGKDRLIKLEDIQGLQDPVSCILLELPQREIGGQLPAYEELEAISTYCREQNIKLHLDGARLFEILPYYQRTAAEVCALFDTVYISFYKGIGGIAGAMLAGSADFTEESKIWKRRHGGDLISLYPYLISSQYYYHKRMNKMEQYYAQAKELAAYFNECHGFCTLPEVPVSNMFHVHCECSKLKLEPILIEIYKETGIGFTHYLKETSEHTCYYELSIGDRYAAVPHRVLQRAFAILDERMREL